MFTIRDATKAFFSLDGTPPEQWTGLDKALRNLSQRIYMPSDGRKGRADTYSLQTICALRLVYKASVFGLDRWQLEKFSNFLQVAEPMNNARKEAFAGGHRVLPPIEEAIQRVSNAESFVFGISMLSDGTIKPFADWDTDEKEDLSLLEGPSFVRLPEDARFTIPASRMIAELFIEFEAAN
ncbi:MAG: hypothetical protein ABJN72_07015 [Sulfitobacter sp.]